MFNQNKNSEPVNLMNVKTSWNSQGYSNDQYYEDQFQEDNTNSDQNENYIVILNNLLTSQINNEDIDYLMSKFFKEFEDSPDSPDYTIDSIQVFKDCVYIIFLRKFVALDAVKFFDNFEFRGEKIQAQLINNDDLLIRINQFFNSDDSSNIEDSNKLKVVEVDCEILVTTRQFKNYADSLNEKLVKELLGINTQIKYTCDEKTETESTNSNDDLIRDAIKRDLLYVIQIDQACEQFNSINVFVLNQWRNLSDENVKKFNFSNKISKIVSKKRNFIKENQNMPLNKALELLKDDYSDYITYLKAKETAHIQLRNSKRLKNNNNMNENENELVTKNLKLINCLLQNFHGKTEEEISAKELRVKDLEFLIIYLDRLKANALRIPDLNDYEEKNNKDSSEEYDLNENEAESTSNIKPLLETDLTQNKPPQPLMPPQPLLQPPQPLLPPQPKPLLSPQPRPLLSPQPPKPLLQQQPLPQSQVPRPLIPPQPLIPPNTANLPYQQQIFNPASIMPNMAQLSQMAHQMSQQMLPLMQPIPPRLPPSPLFPNYQSIQQQPHDTQNTKPPLPPGQPQSLMSLPDQSNNRPSLMNVQAKSQQSYPNYNQNNNNNNKNNYKRY